MDKEKFQRAKELESKMERGKQKLNDIAAIKDLINDPCYRKEYDIPLPSIAVIRENRDGHYTDLAFPILDSKHFKGLMIELLEKYTNMIENQLKEIEKEFAEL